MSGPGPGPVWGDPEFFKYLEVCSGSTSTWREPPRCFMNARRRFGTCRIRVSLLTYIQHRKRDQDGAVLVPSASGVGGQRDWDCTIASKPPATNVERGAAASAADQITGNCPRGGRGSGQYLSGISSLDDWGWASKQVRHRVWLARHLGAISEAVRAGRSSILLVESRRLRGT